MYYENFQKLCEAKNVKPGTVSRATGISTATLTSWKQGKYTPKTDKLQLIADFFGVTLGCLTNGENSEGYYFDDETAKAAQEMFENKELKLLFDDARDASPEDIRTVHNMLLALKRKENGENDKG